MESLIGRTLGKYQVTEEIGAGGMASVFKAYQPGLDRYVALKVLPPLYAGQPGFQERFTREAKAVARLNHPNILPVYDYGESGDFSYIVMRYVEAGTLQGIVGEPLDLSLTVKIVSQIGMALEAAHQVGIIHRDVKPANVLLDKGDWVLLTDFGLARILQESIHLTGSGLGIGTPTYMSPEQGQGEPVDSRTDIYALGTVLFQMLTGDVPFKGDTPLSIVVKRMTEPVPVPSEMNPDIPQAVEGVILKSLAMDPDDRFRSAAEMVAQLAECSASGDDVHQVGETSVLQTRSSRDHTRSSDVTRKATARVSPAVAADTAVRDVSPHQVPARPARDGSNGGSEKTDPIQPADASGQESEPRRRGCPLWLIGATGIAGVVLLVLAAVLAVRMVPEVREMLRVRDENGTATATSNASSVTITPGPASSRPASVPEVEPTARPGSRRRVPRAGLPPGHGAITGLVRDTRGNTLPGVKLELMDARSRDRTKTVESGPNGSYEAILPVGRYIVAFRDNEDPRNLVPQFFDQQNYLLAADAAKVLEVVEGEELRGINVSLEKGDAVSGRLVDREGKPVEGKSGGLASRDAGVALVGALGFGTDRDGRFRAVVPPGRYVLSFEGPLVRREVFVRKEITVDGDVDVGDVVYERKLPVGSGVER